MFVSSPIFIYFPHVFLHFFHETCMLPMCFPHGFPMIFMFSRDFSHGFSQLATGVFPCFPPDFWRLRQARQVVESAVAFNLPAVEATVDEMQALR